MLFRRIVLWIIILSLAGAGGWYIFTPKSIMVETSVATKGRFVSTITEDGRTRVRDRFTVSAPLTGRMSRISLRAGDIIKAGQTIAVIRPTLPPLIDPRARQELQARVGAAEASVAEAKAAQERLKVLRDKAKIAYDRALQLRERGVVSASSLDDATFAYNAAERDLSAAAMRMQAALHSFVAARAALQQSQQDKAAAGENFPVTSPIDGKVLRVLQESAATINAGAPLLEIGQPGNLEVAVDLLTNDAVRIREGSAVTIDRWGGEQTLIGRVRRIEPSAFTKTSALGVEEQRVWVIIDIVSPTAVWQRLADGFRVEASIVAEEVADAIIVPSGALFRRSEAWYLFAAEYGTARLRKVEIGLRSGQSATVTSGLRAGEKVVIFPPSTLSDGKRVTSLQ
jgi:HlyD family secretion protein